MKPWTWRQAIIKSDLPSTTRHVLLTLACHINDAGEQAFPSIRLLAFETGLSRQAVMTHMQTAAAAGWVRTTKHGYGGQKWARNAYDPCIPDGFVPRSFENEASTIRLSTGGQPDAEKAVNDVDQENEKVVNVVDIPAGKAVNDVTEGGQPDAEKAVNDVDTNRPVEASNEKTILSQSREKRARKKSNDDTDADFERAWSIYPKREGGNPKAAALKAWRARLREGEDAERLIAATGAYASAQRRAGNVGTRFVKLASTFFGPDRHYADFAPRHDDADQSDLLTAGDEAAPWWVRAGFRTQWEAINIGVTEGNAKHWRDGRPLIKIVGANVEPWPEGTYERP
ncbi:helix-turn-helix domain-containing protein [Burkholderia sp. LMG 13014]|uniref:helix-turn-helix domain-containing protein n=1 Tax=Burkholderia sp. LMG 13014 TaxID=2709306 RepID=UPI0019656AF7|nr:helix-turn-helix domain-containing protein [Burkholderia sp. LMG 13014]